MEKEKEKVDIKYTKYFGLTLTKRIQPHKASTSNYYRVFQRNRLNKSKLIRELKTFVDILEKENELNLKE